MHITKIESQKKLKNRSSVFIDGEFAFGMSDYDVFRFRLKEGMEITENDIENLREESLYDDLKRYALSLLDRKYYTEKALREKLSARGSDMPTMDKVIDFLKEYRYIDDYEFAKRYIEEALGIGKSGMRKICYDLNTKGIHKEILDQVLLEIEDVNEAEEQGLLKIIEKRLGNDFSYENLAKTKRYCLSRGFSNESIDTVINRFKNNEEEWLDAYR